MKDLKVHEMTGRCEGSFFGLVLGHVGFIQQICGWFSGCQNHDVSLPTRGWCLQRLDALKLNIETLCWPVCPPHNIQYTEYFWMLFPTGPYLSLAPQNPTYIADSIRIPSLIAPKSLESWGTSRGGSFIWWRGLAALLLLLRSLGVQ